MKKKDVEIGGIYAAKVSGKLARVRIERENPYGGWDAVNVDTGRHVRIKSAQRLRYPAHKLPSNVRASRTAPSKACEQETGNKNPLAEYFPDPDPSGEQLECWQAETELGPADESNEVYDPDVCATVGCGRPAALTYLGRARCQECYEDDVADNDVPDRKKMSKHSDTKKGSKQPKAASPAGDAKPKRVSALDAAAQVLAQADRPMRVGELIAAMAERGLWTSPNGKTPEATLYAAIIREIATKGEAARFRKADLGQFAYNGKEA